MLDALLQNWGERRIITFPTVRVIIRILRDLSPTILFEWGIYIAERTTRQSQALLESCTPHPIRSCTVTASVASSIIPRNPVVKPYRRHWYRHHRRR
jgi:hypothetical protein